MLENNTTKEIFAENASLECIHGQGLCMECVKLRSADLMA